MRRSHALSFAAFTLTVAPGLPRVLGLGHRP